MSMKQTEHPRHMGLLLVLHRSLDGLLHRLEKLLCMISRSGMRPRYDIRVIVVGRAQLIVMSRPRNLGTRHEGAMDMTSFI